MAVPDWLTSVTYAHRGVHGDGIVENTQAAFAAAIERGLGIECDVRLSSDSEVVVFHDATLERLTEQKGPVNQLTAAQLAKVAIRGDGAPMPTLPGLLRQVGGRVPLLVEIKSDDPRGAKWLASAVAASLAGYAGPCAVMSFDPRVIGWFAGHRPERMRGLVVSQQEKTGVTSAVMRLGGAAIARPHFLACDIRDLPTSQSRAARDRGVPVLTWTVRDTAQVAIGKQHADAMIAEGQGLA